MGDCSGYELYVRCLGCRKLIPYMDRLKYDRVFVEHAGDIRYGCYICKDCYEKLLATILEGDYVATEV